MLYANRKTEVWTGAFATLRRCYKVVILLIALIYICFYSSSTKAILSCLVLFWQPYWKFRQSTQCKVWCFADRASLYTARCRVLLEQLTGLQPVKKFPAFHWTPRFITALTSVRHLSLSWASPIHSTYTHLTSCRSILILSTHLRLGLPIGLFPSGFPTKTYTLPSPHPYTPHAQPISFFSILSPAQYWVRSTKHLSPRYAISSIPPIPRPS